MPRKGPVDKNQEAFSNACLDGDMKRVKQLASSKLDLTEVWTGELFYPLMAAIVRNNVELAVYLMDNGMPIYFNTASSFKEFDTEELRRGDLVINEWAPEYAEALLAVSDYAKRFDLAMGCSRTLAGLADLDECDCDERTDQFINNLLAAGADVDYVMPRGDTPLHVIAEGKNKKYVEKLIGLSKNVDAHSADEPDDTPLFAATSKCWDFAIIALVERGADVNVVSEALGATVLDSVIRFAKENPYWNTDGNLDRLIEFLRARGAKTYAEIKAEAVP